MRQCRIKKGKETRSFPSHNPFTLYSFLFYWLSERYNILESFAGVVCCDKHLCPFLALTQRCSSQDCGIATLGKLHQLADKYFLLGCRWYIMQYLVLLRSVDTDVLGSTEVANLRIKVIEVNVIGWLQKENINKNNKRWTIWKRASFFILLYFAIPQRTLYSILQRYKFFTRRYTDFKKFIETSLYEIGKIGKNMKIREKRCRKICCKQFGFIYLRHTSLLYFKSATKPLNVLIAFTRPLITEFADNLNLKHPLLPTISPYPTMWLEAIHNIIPISCRHYPKSVWKTSA